MSPPANKTQGLNIVKTSGKIYEHTIEGLYICPGSTQVALHSPGQVYQVQASCKQRIRQVGDVQVSLKLATIQSLEGLNKAATPAK